MMKKVVLIYWGTGGNVEHAAKKVASTFSADEIHLTDLKSFDIIHYHRQLFHQQ